MSPLKQYFKMVISKLNKEDHSTSYETSINHFLSYVKHFLSFFFTISVVILQALCHYIIMSYKYFLLEEIMVDIGYENYKMKECFATISVLFAVLTF